MSKRKKGPYASLPANAGGQHPEQVRYHPPALISAQELRIAPLPKPEEMERYEMILPGLADRIVTMAEENGRDRRRNNRTMRWVSILGPVFAFIILMTGLLGGFALANNDKDLAGVAAIVTAIATPLGVFVWNRTRKS